MNDTPVDTFGLPISKDVCFSTHKNTFRPRTMKRQLKILKAFAPWLKQLLAPGEEILLAVRACSPMSLLEQLTLGWVIFYSKRCVLVFTNKRILHFPTRTNFSPRSSVAQVQYGDLEETKLRGFLGRVLTLRYKSGRKEGFNHVQSHEFKKLKALLPSLAKDGPPSPARERHHLCPRCQARLVKDRFSCPDCRLEFKDRERARRLSWLYPGGGYFYTGHPVLGVMDAIAETILLIALIVALIDGLTGATGPEGWVSVALIAGLLALEKIETVYHAKHYVNEYIPLEKVVPAIPTARAGPVLP